MKSELLTRGMTQPTTARRKRLHEPLSSRFLIPSSSWHVFWPEARGANRHECRLWSFEEHCSPRRTSSGTRRFNGYGAARPKSRIDLAGHSIRNRSMFSANSGAPCGTIAHPSHLSCPSKYRFTYHRPSTTLASEPS